MLSDNIKGALLLTLSCLVMCFDNTIIHHFGYSYGIPAAQIFFLKVCTSLFLVSFVIIYNDRTLFKSYSLGYQLARSCFGAAGNFLWISALTKLPIAYAVCLSMASVFFNYIGSIVFYKEKFNLLRLSCCLIGFLALLSTLKSEHIIFGAAILFPLASSMCFSAASLMIKKVSQTDSVMTTLFYLLLCMTMVSLPNAYHQWQPLSYSSLAPLCFLGLLYLLAQITLISAYKIAEITFISPFKFSKVPANFLIGAFIFHEVAPPNSYRALGAILVCSMVLFVSEFLEKRSHTNQLNALKG